MQTPVRRTIVANKNGTKNRVVFTWPPSLHSSLTPLLSKRAQIAAWRMTNSPSRAISFRFPGAFSGEFAYQSAAHQPTTRLNEEVARKMLVFFRRPCTHGEMPDHCGKLILEEDETRRTMREPADVIKRFPEFGSGGGNESAMQRAANGLYKSEHQAFRRLRSKTRELLCRNQVAEEKSGPPRPLGARRFKPPAPQAPRALGAGAIAAQVGRGQRANPAHLGHIAGQKLISAGMFQAYRPSNG